MSDLTTVASPAGLGEFCALRQEAWRVREAGGPRGMSSDPVLARYHFTNVYRDLDPGSVLGARLLYRWRTTGDGHVCLIDSARTVLRHNALWTAVAYRTTNRRSVWEEFWALSHLGRYPSMDVEEEWLDYLHAEAAAGRRVFTGRHYTMGLASYVRTLQTVRHLEPAWVDAAFADAATFSERVRELPGVGQFFGWQVTADLLASGHLPADPDHVSLGPGAKLALRWILERRPWAQLFNATGRRVVLAGDGHLPDHQAEAQLLALRATQAAWLPSTFVPHGGRRLELVDLEHALCEYARWGVYHHKLVMRES